MSRPASQGKPELFIGVDGGGTGCRARIEDADGRVLGQGSAGPASIRLGLDASLAAIDAACRASAEDAQLPAEALSQMHAVIGLAGACRRGALEQLRSRPQPFRSVTYLSDAKIACIGAHGGRDGGIVIIGTGSVGLAVIGGRELRVGGYGFPISDEGSGADIGLRAIRAALRARDGRAPATAFTQELMGRFGNDLGEVVAWTDRASATDYASLAPLVVRHANAEDQVARAILTDAAAHIDDIVRRLTAYGAPRIALLGGLAPVMESWLARDVRDCLVAPEGDAVDGALRVARDKASSWLDGGRDQASA